VFSKGYLATPGHKVSIMPRFSANLARSRSHLVGRS